MMLRQVFTPQMFRFLLLLLFAVFFMVAFQSHSPDWNVHFDPTKSYWTGPADGQKYVLTSVSISVFALYFVYAFITCIVGAGTALSLFPGLKDLTTSYGLTPFLVASYSFGAIVLTALNRISTLVISNRAGLILSMAVVAILVAGTISPLREFKRSQVHPRGYSKENKTIYIFGVLLVLFVAVVFQLHAGNTHIIGDGAKFTLDIVKWEERLGLGGKVPLVKSQYDELLYLFPLLLKTDFLSNSMSNVLQVFWLHSSFAKTSSFILMVYVGLLLRLQLASAVLAVTICFLGSVFLIPVRHMGILDSGAPMVYSVHAGRVFVTALFIAVLTFCRAGLLSHRLRYREIVLVLLFALGLGALTMSAVSILVAFVVGLVLERTRYSISALATLIIVMASGFLLTSFSLETSNRLLGALIALGCVAVAGLAFVAMSLNRSALPLGRLREMLRYKVVALLALGYLFSLLLLGNVFIQEHNWMQAVGQVIVYRGIDPPAFGLGANPFCGRTPHDYCANSTAFISAYGFPMALALMVAFFSLASTRARVLRPAITLAGFSAFLYLVSHFVYVFMNGGAATELDFWVIWFKSRLVEPFFYASILFSLISLSLLQELRSKKAEGQGGVLAAWINPLTIGLAMFLAIAAVVDGTPKVLLANLDYLLSLEVRCH